MRRSLLAIVLILSFLIPAASRATPLDPLWALFVEFWKATALDAGCGADPNGRCQSARSLASDAGCGMDPNGWCSTAKKLLPADEGCGMDPDGRCNPAQRLEADAGCGMDPDGRCNPAR